METILKTFFFKSMNNGFLYGPIIPIYGFGACLIIIIMRFIFNRIKVNRISKIMLLFLVSIIILTTLEFLGGHLIKLLTGKTFWNYNKLKYNLGPFISLEISLVWGIMSLIITYLIKPLTDKLERKIPSIITYLVFTIFIIDLFCSLIFNSFK